jgi:hypothetical protein
MFECKMLYRFYKIYSDLDDEMIYVGKTTQTLNKRFGEHKSYYRNNITIKLNGPNQRQVFESKMNEYLQQGYQMIKDKKII